MEVAVALGSGSGIAIAVVVIMRLQNVLVGGHFRDTCFKKKKNKKKQTNDQETKKVSQINVKVS